MLNVILFFMKGFYQFHLLDSKSGRIFYVSNYLFTSRKLALLRGKLLVSRSSKFLPNLPVKVVVTHLFISNVDDVTFSSESFERYI